MKQLSFMISLLLLPQLAFAKTIDDVVNYGSKISPGFFGIILTLNLLYSRHWFRLKIRDGWSWDKHAQRALFVSILCSGALFHFWPERVFLHVAAHWWIFASAIANGVLRWASAELVLKFKYQNPHELKRHRILAQPYQSELSALSGAILVGAMFNLPWFSFLQDIFLVAAIAWRSFRADWAYIFKNATLSSITFFVTIQIYGLSLPLHVERASYIASICVLLAGLIRIRGQLSINAEAIAITKSAYSVMQEFSSGKDRLQALCSLLQDEWAMARASIVSINGNEGILLASAGPQALSVKNIFSQKLGPILRRVHREAHSIYSPVANECGGENIFQRLRHSSFAVPIFANEEMVAVVCLMAEGEEKINQRDARTVELVCRQISKDIIAAIAIEKLELSNEKLHALLKNSNALLLTQEMDSVNRIVIRAEVNCCHGVLPSLEKRYRDEVFAAWDSIRTVLGFHALERNDSCFWAVAPIELNSDNRQSTNLISSSLVLADLLSRQAELIARDEGFRALNVGGAKIIVANGEVPGAKEKLSVSIFTTVDKLARSAMVEFGELYTYGLPLSFFEGISTNAPQAICIDTHRDVYAWRELSLDKKEIRKLESLAQQLAKDLKGAA